MIFVRRFAFLVAGLSCVLLPGTALAAKAKSSSAKQAAPAYKGAIIMDAASGKILFEDHRGDPSPPASMTKLMTFLVLHDKLKSGALTLATPVTVEAADSKIGGTQVWLKEKEVFPVEELLYAMMIQSANDAAYALARTAAGSTSAFVELMNAKARELGMTQTTFRTPHGLPPSNRRISEGDLSTPNDFALLCRELLLKTDVLTYCSVKTREFGGAVRPEPVVMNNHNHLLGKIAGVDGLKTGFTNGAGFCLSATAQRNGQRVIVVVMGSPDRKLRDIKVAELIERGFAALPANAAAFVPAEASPITRATVGAAADSVIVPAPAPVSDEPPTIKFRIPSKK
jgi:D-alanyl-D-alanine carboxypeptidase (penicillin-binding protein 5/6)